jgi:hypothetical protein
MSRARYKINHQTSGDVHFYTGSFAIHDTSEKRYINLIAHCSDEQIAKKICAALNASEGGVNIPSTRKWRRTVRAVKNRKAG